MELLEQGSGFPVDEIKIQSALRRRLIYLIGDIDDASVFEVEYLLDRIVALDEDIKLKDEEYTPEAITIRLQTRGGSVSAGLGLIGMIECLKDRGYWITIEVIGYCMSMGVIITSCGSNRTCHRHDRFMSHTLSAGTDGKLDDMRNLFLELDSLQNSMDGILISNTKITQELLTSKSHHDWYFTAEEALRLGLIDIIL